MRRALLLFAALLFLGFATYGSLVPLELRHIPFSEGVTQFLDTPFEPLAHASGTDFVTNVLLFVPIGFFFLGTAAPRGSLPAIGCLVPVVLLCIAASMAIEFSQVFVVGRTPSWDDVFAESLGAVVGTVLWVIAGSITVDWFSAVLNSDSRRERLLRMLGAYVLLWGILGLLPFNFTIRPQELAEKFRAGRILLRPFDHAGIEKVLSTFLFTVPIGAFGLVFAQTRHLRPAKMWALGIGLSAVVALEFGQLLVFSRTADSTDIIMGACGVLAGVALTMRADRDGLVRTQAGAGVRLWPIAVLALWLMLVVARHWSPFDFRADSDFIRGRLPMLFRVPFYSYYWASPMNAFAEVATKGLLGVPVGGLLQSIYFPRTRAGRRWQSVGIAIVSFAIFLVIELGQLLLQSRYPDQTDVYIGTVGGCLGMVAVRLLIPRRANRSEPAAPSLLRVDS